MCPSHTHCKIDKGMQVHTHMQNQVKPVCEVLVNSVLKETNSSSLFFSLHLYFNCTRK